MTDIFSDPNLQHPVLTPREMAMIADVCDRGFDLDRQLSDSMVQQSLRVNVHDSFRLHPGTYEAKWGINRDAMLRKLALMSPRELMLAADRVDAFWDEAQRQQAARGLARRGGLATRGISTAAKRRAARRNAKRGGRPRKNR